MRFRPRGTAFGWSDEGPDGADARLASPIARRMSSPAAKTASPVLASGLIGCGGKSEAWFAVLVCRAEGDAPEGADRDDQLLTVHREREEAEAGLRDRKSVV